MRGIGLAAVILLAACNASPGSSASGTPTASNAPAATPRATCRLPVWWPENATATEVDIHAAFVSFPNGAVADAGVLPQLSLSLPGLTSVEAYGATYDSASNQWVHADRAYLSPDRTRLAYWASTGINANTVHVLDLATGVDHLLYSGSTLFIVIAFEPEGIYLVHGIAPRQGAFEKLYLLDPTGGSPALVPGSDRHMYQYGWVLISDGAAWGLDFRVDGAAYIYSVVRLDLATAQATKWIESAPDEGFSPLGTDSKHRLYVGGVQSKLWRIGPPGQAEVLPNPGPVIGGGGLGSPTSFVSDSLDAWLAGRGGVWLYGDTGEPRLFAVGPQSADVSPAGPCL